MLKTGKREVERVEKSVKGKILNYLGIADFPESLWYREGGKRLWSQDGLEQREQREGDS